MPVHSRAREPLRDGLQRPALVCPFSRRLRRIKTKTNELRHLDRGSLFWLVQARAKARLASGWEKKVCRHSFRATGITKYLNVGGTIHIAQRNRRALAGFYHQIYDRSKDRATIAEIERLFIRTRPNEHICRIRADFP